MDEMLAMSNDSTLTNNCDSAPNWLCPEGYARITRDGKTDIYRIVAEVLLAGEGVCFASSMEDYDLDNPGRSYGKKMVLHHTDTIEFLGTVESYFSKDADLLSLKKLLLSLIPDSAGLITIVRAVEILKDYPCAITESAVQSVASRAYVDYLQRRAALTVSQR